MRARRPLAVLGLVAVLVAGCRSTGHAGPAAPESARPAWRSVTLPAPPGAPGRLLLRDATACGGRWFVVGAVVDSAGVPRPAAWTSADASRWTALRPVPRSPYGGENVLTAAGCREGRLAAVGGRSGGVHGNPRISTWRQVADGSLVEVPAEFEVFGGPDAVNVGRIAGGPSGWLVAGNRATGGAAWLSADGSEFRLVSAVPGLAADGSGRPWVSDGVATASGWLLVGSMLASSGRTGSDPVVWSSADGLTWRRAVLSGAATDEDLQRVTRVGERPVAVGRRGDALGTWLADGAAWRAGGGFGGAGTDRPGRVWSLAAVADGALAVVAGGATGAGWFSRDGSAWSPVTLPVAVPARSDRSVAVASVGASALLMVDDGTRAEVWWADGPWSPG